VVVARTALRAGEPLRADQLATRDWPADALPSGAYASIDEIMTGHPGATPVVGILAGEPVVAGRLSSGQAGAGIASLVRTGMRGIALRIDDAAGATGLVYPGAVVDVVATVRDPNGRGPSARIAVQDARVLSVGRETDVATRRADENLDEGNGAHRGDRGTFVTLEVTPADAEVLAVARNEGRIDLVLRNATDQKTVDTDGVTPDAFSAFAPAGKRPADNHRAARRQTAAPDRTAPRRGGGIEVYHAP
jgi:pilus assembly protein CpaB